METCRVAYNMANSWFCTLPAILPSIVSKLKLLSDLSLCQTSVYFPMDSHIWFLSTYVHVHVDYHVTCKFCACILIHKGYLLYNLYMATYVHVYSAKGYVLQCTAHFTVYMPICMCEEMYKTHIWHCDICNTTVLQRVAS